MHIPYSLINFYLSQITVGYFNDHDLPPRDVTGYQSELANLEGLALRHGELDELKLGLEYLLARPEIDCTPLNGGRYPFRNEDMRRIVQYVWQSLWPDAEPVPPGGPPGVQLNLMSLDEWRARR